jgi:aspartate/methionine/tyrosine aminotransferase
MYEPTTRHLLDSPIGWADRLAARYDGKKPVLDVSQGAPHYPPPPSVQEHVSRVARSKGGARYTERRGILALREQIVDSLRRESGANVSVDNVLVTAGCNQAFCITTKVLAYPGDEIILHKPYYFNHDMWLRMEHMRPVYVETAPSYEVDATALSGAISERTRAIVLVTPSNPTGAIASPDVIAQIANVARENRTFLVLDETYRAFRGTSTPSHTLLQSDRWSDHVVELFSFSKEFSLAGYRIGAIVAAEDLINEMLKVLDCMAVCAPRLGQEAALVALGTAGAWRKQKSDEVDMIARTFQQVMTRKPGGFVLDAHGPFYGWVRHPFDGSSTQEVLESLFLEQGVLALSGAVFTGSDDGHLRISHANLTELEVAELGARLDEFRTARGGASGAV